MIEIHLNEVDLRMQITADGMHHLALIDPRSGIVVRLQVPEEAAKQLATGLVGPGIVVAQPATLKEIEH